jgi:hypothetical protein
MMSVKSELGSVTTLGAQLTIRLRDHALFREIDIVGRVAVAASSCSSVVGVFQQGQDCCG